MATHGAHRLLPSTRLAIARLCVNERSTTDDAFNRCEGGGLSLGQHVTPPRVHRARDEVRSGAHETRELFPQERLQWKVALVLALGATASASASGAFSAAAIGTAAAVTSATGTLRSTAASVVMCTARWVWWRTEHRHGAPSAPLRREHL